MDYLLLANPGHNRVYFHESRQLCQAELSLVLGPEAELGWITLCGVDYLNIHCKTPLSSAQLRNIGMSSCMLALFEQRENGSLLPLDCGFRRWMDDSICTVLRYTGKTNELFTRSMLHLAALSSDFDPCQRLSVLDPVAGKGTTLFEALTCGYNASGIELSEQSVTEGTTFFAKFLEHERWKFTRQSERISGPGRSFTAKKTIYTLAPDKESMKNGDSRTVSFVCGDSAHAASLFPKESFHVITGDLPYGIQHGNVSNGRQSGSITRNPISFVHLCADGWYKLLKKGGVLALSWNSFLLSREDLRAALADHGFQPLAGGSYDLLEHRVDQAIRRDLVLAKK